MTVTCNIEFENNPNKIVYAGQVLRGTVGLTFSEPKTVRSIYIRIYGKGYCRWKQGKNYQTGREDYFNEMTFLRNDGNPDIKVEPGNYKYNFQCNLPAELPTSVEGGYGYIRYTARVVLDIPLWTDTEFKERFTVIKPLDLNQDPALHRPISCQETDLGCFSSLDYTVRIPVTGYTPGQVINVKIHVDNSSRRDVEFVVKLIKKIHYFSDTVLDCCGTPTKRESRFIAQEKARGPTEGSDGIVCINLRVPPIPPTDVSTSKVVKVTYYLRVSASVGVCCDPSFRIPIAIGSYPIRDFETDENGPAPTAPIETAPSATAPPYDQPPTYEEAMDMTDFRPKYPVFKRQTSYSIGI